MTLGGRVVYDDGWTIPDLRALRCDSIGFIFQAPYLIPFLDATDKVALLPMLAVIGLFEQMARHYATAIIVVTHDEKIIPTFRRPYHIRDGRTVEQERAAA